MNALQVNPAIGVEAQFVGRADGVDRTSRFVLARDPAIATWLLSVLDHVLWRQGVYADERRIEPPPGGELLDRLIAGAVILAERRADGGVALRLNPGFDVALWLTARRPRLPAYTTHVGLGAEPDVARWLLDWACQHDRTRALPPPGPLRAALERHCLLVPELPSPAVTLPGAHAATDPDGAATATRAFRQAAGSRVPPEVGARLGRHTPRLPADRDLVWYVDAGSELVFPWLAPAAPPPLPGPATPGRLAFWTGQCDREKARLATRRYAVLQAILPAAPREALRCYVRALVEHGYFPALGDGQVELRAAIHNEPGLAALHRGLARIVSDVSGEEVQGSYCYLACYESGATLPRHVDRPQCRYNLSLVIDMADLAGGPEPAPWPIYLELDGRPEPVLLATGDGLLYSGTELFHWRDALPPGQRAIVCFFHFVPVDFRGSLD